MTISPSTKALDPQETEISLPVAMWGEVSDKVWNGRTEFSRVKGAGDKERAKGQISSFSPFLDLSWSLGVMWSVLCLASAAQRARCKGRGPSSLPFSP